MCTPVCNAAVHVYYMIFKHAAQVSLHAYLHTFQQWQLCSLTLVLGGPGSRKLLRYDQSWSTDTIMAFYTSWQVVLLAVAYKTLNSLE